MLSSAHHLPRWGLPGCGVLLMALALLAHPSAGRADTGETGTDEATGTEASGSGDAGDTLHAPPPGSSTHAAPPEPVAPEPAPVVTPEQWRQYRESRLRVGRSRLYWRPRTWLGGAWTFHRGPATIHVGGAVPVEPVSPGGAWAVFEDRRRLQVPEYLDLVGNDALYRDLTGDIRRAGTWSDVWLATVVAGAVATVGGTIAFYEARDIQARYTADAVAGLGILGMIGGAIGRNITVSRVHDLRYRFGRTLDLADTRSEVEAYNRALKKRLGLPPDREPPPVFRRP